MTLARTRETDVVAVILAAGRGTRMGELTETIPKPLLPVLGKPALHWVLDGLLSSGVHRFVIVTGYLSEMINKATSGYGGVGIDIKFVHQDEQLGTGHAMRLTREVVGGAPMLLAFADIMTSPDNFAAMIDHYDKGMAEVVAAVRDAGDPWRAAAVYTDENGQIRQIIEKPEIGTSKTPWSHAGMYCFSNAIYDYLEQLTPSARGEYEVTDAVQMMIADGRASLAVELQGYWKDLATPQDIAAAERMMAIGPVEPHVV